MQQWMLPSSSSPLSRGIFYKLLGSEYFENYSSEYFITIDKTNTYPMYIDTYKYLYQKIMILQLYFHLTKHLGASFTSHLLLSLSLAKFYCINDNLFK